MKVKEFVDVATWKTTYVYDSMQRCFSLNVEFSALEMVECHGDEEIFSFKAIGENVIKVICK